MHDGENAHALLPFFLSHLLQKRVDGTGLKYQVSARRTITRNVAESPHGLDE